MDPCFFEQGPRLSMVLSLERFDLSVEDIVLEVEVIGFSLVVLDGRPHSATKNDLGPIFIGKSAEEERDCWRGLAAVSAFRQVAAVFNRTGRSSPHFVPCVSLL